MWADAMWLDGDGDGDGDLWIPASQLDRTPGKNHGRNSVKLAATIYKLHIDLHIDAQPALH